MKKIFCALFICFNFMMHAYASTPIDTSIAPMLQKVLPSIVNIRAKIKVTDFNTLLELRKERGKTPDNVDSDNPDNSTFTSVGSGVIVDAKNAYILTNAHVVNDAQLITVTLSDGRHFTARVVGLDKPSDVGLIQIKAKNLSELKLADSNDLKVGDFVAAIGNPFGLSQTVTSGIVSALGRNTLGIEGFENFIQTDAPINPGNSGGALINMQGELVGINTAILAPARGNIGIGFAIPANMAKSVMTQLIQFGDVKRGLLGIGAEDISPELQSEFGVKNGAIISQVLPYSPAQLAGLKTGDVIVGINTTPIKSASDVINTVGFLRVDSKINVNIMRGNKPMTLEVTLTDPTKRKILASEADPFFSGVAFKNFSISSPIYGDLTAVLVVSADEDSVAWQSDIRPGDIITSVNQKPVRSIEELRSAANGAKEHILLNVIRGGSAVFLVLNKLES